MDIGRAFSFVFEDEEWVKKILIGGAISLIPLIGGWIVYGYMLEMARRVYYAPATAAMPDWDDIGRYLSQGFFFWLGLFCWALPVFLLIFCPLLGIFIAGAASGEETVMGISFVLLYLILFPMIFIFSLASALVIPVLLGRYAIHERFGALFEFGEIWTEVRRIGAVPLLLLIVTYLVAGYIGQLGFMLCIIGVIFTTFFGRVVIAHAAGQTYRLARGIQQPQSAVQAPKGY